MVETTSGTTSFYMPVDEIIERALDPIGGQHTSGIDAQKARSILNLIFIEMQNKNVPLHKIATVSFNLSPGISTYTLDQSIVDVRQINIKKSTESVWIPISRYGLEKFNQIPNKTQQQRPICYSIQRLRDQPVLTVWPVPELGITYNTELLVSKRVEDVDASYQKIDMPIRYLPLVIKWLSYELSVSKAGTDPNLISILKMRKDELMPDTFEEDRERVDMTITPGGISGR